jgi:hypothetical protein
MLNTISILLLFVLFGVAGSNPGPASAATSGARTPRVDPACDSIPAYHLLDFWVGEWAVSEKGVLVGHNRIEKIAGGCALIENWQDVSGEEGKSLFYYLRGRKDWKQVWVQPGGVKEKRLIARYPDGAVRFQGELPRADGSIVLDRTTLSPLPGGRARQVIEQSMDGGQTWLVGFDAVYTKSPQA